MIFRLNPPHEPREGWRSFSPDLRRRTLFVELFVGEVRPELRQIAHPLDDSHLVDLRPKILGCLWTLVRNWADCSFPQPRQIHQSFTRWTKIVGGILEAAGFESPCHQLNSLNGSGDGDRELHDMELLINEMVEGKEYGFGDLVSLSHHDHLFEWIIGEETDDQDGLDPKARSTFGRMLRDRFTDRLFLNTDHPVRFVKTSSTARKKYAIIPVPEEPNRIPSFDVSRCK